MKYQVSIVQDSPIFFDLRATVNKMIDIIKDEAVRGSKLIVFPESYIPGYPRGFSFGAVIGSRSEDGRALYSAYHKNSMSQNGEHMSALVTLCKKLDVYLVFGFTEKLNENGSLYCSMAYISPIAGLMAVHRKIKPTGTERLIWAEGSGRDLVTCDTEIGRLGGLICWENYMPEARISMYRMGVQVYIAPTADARDAWTSTLRHIALEGRCYVFGCNQYMTKSMYPIEYQKWIGQEDEEMCAGGSVIITPLGDIIAGPIYGKSLVLRANINLDDVIKSKLDYDANGHYTRPDIFDLSIHDQPKIIKE